MKNNIPIIIRREYLERVKRKSFIITTILFPILMVVLMILPALVMTIAGPENKTIAVIDNSSQVANALSSSDEIKFVNTDLPEEILRADETYDAILIVGKDIVDNPNDVKFLTRGAASPQTESFVSGQLSSIVEQHRLARYDIDNLQQIMADVNVQVGMKTIRIDSDEDKTTSSVMSSIVGMVMSLVLYMFVLLYGQMVMTSVIEEKNNRVLEVVVSSTKPTHLMLGKILGIGSVALTQILIWCVLICSFTTWVMPSLMTSMLTGSSDVDLLTAITMIGDTGYVFNIFAYLLLFLVGGYLFYSALYAAIGSAVDNIQDASQLSSLAVLPIILGMVFSMTVISDPNSTMAVWLSYIPFTSPMVMMARVPFGIPVEQTIISLVILYISVLFIVWLAAKIYRVGIFMYGKKPTIGELIRWARYK